MLHIPVFLKEITNNIITSRSGLYLDVTFGSGGHSKELLKYLSKNSKLISLDRDIYAFKLGKKLEKKDLRFKIFNANFSKIDLIIGHNKVNGIIADLGTSYMQLSDPKRGFSYLYNGPLDMRMDIKNGIKLYDWIQKSNFKSIYKVLKNFGEERFSKRIARSIIKYKKNIKTTFDLIKIVKKSQPYNDRNKHYATRTFQAFRIKINNELDELKKFLPKAFNCLKKNGRLAIISFHSLEDRIVKEFFNSLKKTEFPKCIPQKNLDTNKFFKYICKCTKPSSKEISKNPRSRSAKLRVIEKV